MRANKTSFRQNYLLIFVLFLCVSAFSFASKTFLFAQDLTEEQTLTLERTRFSGEFGAGGFSANWADAAYFPEPVYLTQKPTKDSCGGNDIVAINPVKETQLAEKQKAENAENHENAENLDAKNADSENTDAETDTFKEILVHASELVPSGASTPLAVSGFTFSPSFSHLLVFTNTQRVWRQHTKGDYWVLDRSSRSLRKLGTQINAAPSSLMFAKISPDEKNVAYVYNNNIYVENLTSGDTFPLTTTGGERFINGTFDWVYEEELDLRDGFRWSPDGKKIAFWQLDTEGVPVHTIINNTEAFYPTLTQFKYPRTGTTNSAA
ncbi:MAG: DPP IV N-terminal domain-containing protein, partial [Thermoguttaceae bacterium]